MVCIPVVLSEAKNLCFDTKSLSVNNETLTKDD
jgi:hypothetical protein